jgi:hypothetical protein
MAVDIGMVKSVGMSIGSVIGAIYMFITPWIKKFAAFIVANREEISAIIIRIQKDSADGNWTNEEKEQMVVDEYKEHIWPRSDYPWVLKLLGWPWNEKRLRKIIGSIFTEARKIKERAKLTEQKVIGSR